MTGNKDGGRKDMMVKDFAIKMSLDFYEKKK